LGNQVTQNDERTLETPTGPRRERAAQAARLIEGSLKGRLDIFGIAEKINVSRRQLERDFRCTYGVSPAEYARRVRFERAASALEAGCAIIDVASDLGYADQSHLTRVMRAGTGRTPRELQHAGRRGHGQLRSTFGAITGQVAAAW
jgi:transcriptional regulator GlxA family with amidase domain